VANKSKSSKRTSALIERAAAFKDADLPTIRLLSKAEVMAISGLSFPSIWAWMRDGRFPRSRVVGGKSMWRSDEIDAWLAGLPVRPLKGDQPSTEAA
jgi:predicted DNA-binding transcriptional regulator AlpA